MKEHTKRQVDVLGIDVSVMRPEKAVNITMNYLNRKGVGMIYFHSAASSLFTRTNEWAIEQIQSCDLVLPGDRYMEDAVMHNVSQGETSTGNSLFADTYMKRLLHKLNREYREIFTVVEKEEDLTSLKEYFDTVYSDISVQGTVLNGKFADEAGRVVNEINGHIPDIVFICLPSEMQLKFLRDYQTMMNTRLIICIESLQPLIKTETEMVPEWIQNIGLSGLYQWFKKKGKLQDKIIGSIFRQTIADKTASEDSEKQEGEE